MTPTTTETHPMSTADINKPTGPATAAATDVQEWLTDLDGGQFERALSVALSQVAASVVDNGKPGEVQIRLKLKPIQRTHQVAFDTELKFLRPTLQGKAIETALSMTVMHVGKFGRLSLAQPSLLDGQQQKLMD